MNRTELSERSPLRHFDQSMHGGLGRGQLGIVASRRGVGKTPFLVHVALDALLRERRVLHLSHEHTVDHVRAYYDEIFLDLAERSRLEDAEAVRLDIERRRLI
jgi:KaiC/GvpD/RAD55 family RecA-like ATPase